MGGAWVSIHACYWPETSVSRRALGACRGAELAPRESGNLVCNCFYINGGATPVAIKERIAKYIGFLAHLKEWLKICRGLTSSKLSD